MKSCVGVWYYSILVDCNNNDVDYARSCWGDELDQYWSNDCIDLSDRLDKVTYPSQCCN